MDQLDLRLKALEQMKEWSVWMITIETGALILATSTDPAAGGTWWFVATLVCYVISILTASWLLSAYPSVTQLLTHDTNVYDAPLFKGHPRVSSKITVYRVGLVQHATFAVGTICLAFYLHFRITV